MNGERERVGETEAGKSEKNIMCARTFDACD